LSLPTSYQNFIALSRYARFQDSLGRREVWPETVQRYFDFMVPFVYRKTGVDVTDTARHLSRSVLNLEAMPSMRCLMTAGPALERDHIAGYNCAYRPINDVKAFDEIMYVLMCGTGIAWSVERQYVNRLPTVPANLTRSDYTIVVRDSKLGWADALRQFIEYAYQGYICQIDTSRVRRKGARLKTMGGRASGPEPLEDVFKFITKVFDNAKGRKLHSIEVHDIACVISDAVVVGGVRRAAALSLSNLSDQRMRDAKTGAWWETHLHRRLANNSVAFTETPEVGQFMDEFKALFDSKSGERGIFNREAARAQAMQSGRRRGFWDEPVRNPASDDMTMAESPSGEVYEAPIDFGTNPCSEIILRPEELCNLSSAVARPDDSPESLERKVRDAAIMGTWQSMLTDFRHVNTKWRRNCEEERLLGVSLTGIMDCPLLNDHRREDLPELLEHLNAAAVDENRKWAKELGIRPTAAATCVKPEGTSSELVGSSSGIHPTYAHRYIRRVRMDRTDPLCQFMVNAGFPHEPEIGKEDRVMVFSFPKRAPETAVTRDDMSAVDQLEHWKVFQDHYCEHKPSVTVQVREQEWPEVMAWCWRHFDKMSGVAFLPYDGGSYRQAPFEEVGETELLALEAKIPSNVNWTGLTAYESTDHTTGSREMACSAGGCDVT